MAKTCDQCALRNPQNKICGLFGEFIKDNTNACPKFQSDLNQCDVCHTVSINPLVYWKDIVSNQLIAICDKCSQLIGKCKTCKFSNSCDFETNPSPLPKTVQKQIRQGNAVMITTVNNPERIDITCKQNCKCYNNECDCMKQTNFCDNWEYFNS